MNTSLGRNLVFATLLVALMASAVYARTWTSLDGQFSVEADYIGELGGQAVLRKADGQVICVKPDALIETDRQFIRDTSTPDRAAQIDADYPSRTWDQPVASNAGFIGIYGKSIVLRQPGGKIVGIHWDQVEPTDRDFVRSVVPELAKRQFGSQQTVEPKTPSAKPTEPTESTDGASSDPEPKTRTQTVALELKRAQVNTGTAVKPIDRLLQEIEVALPTVYLLVLGKPYTSSVTQRFQAVVTEEPTYHLPQPFLSVLRIGENEFAFAIDSSTLDKTGKPADLNVLHFDANHDGDLTNDPKVIGKVQANNVGSGDVEFPQMDMKIQVDGRPLDYSFTLSSRHMKTSTGTYNYALIYQRGAAYRIGEITLGGRKQQLALVDANGNGRFDDQLKVSEVGGKLLATNGDRIVLGTGLEGRLSSRWQVTENALLAPRMKLGGKFYRVEVSPLGDKLSITQLKNGEMGQIRCPPGLDAILFNEAFGPLPLSPTGGPFITVPADTWWLCHCSLPGPGQATITCNGQESTRPIVVEKGEIVDFPYGRAFRPIVSSHDSLVPGDTIELQLNIEGAFGEICKSFLVKDTTPTQTHRLTIKNDLGKTVLGDQFKPLSTFPQPYRWRVPVTDAATKYLFYVQLDLGPFKTHCENPTVAPVHRNVSKQ